MNSWKGIRQTERTNERETGLFSTWSFGLRFLWFESVFVSIVSFLERTALILFHYFLVLLCLVLLIHLVLTLTLDCSAHL